MDARQVGRAAKSGRPARSLVSAVVRCRVTSFQRRVYDWISAIPAGRVATYGGVARGIGCRSCRAVGQALRRNPFAPRVPCHRVIAGDLTLGGFNGCRDGAELARKRRLLAAEGVQFDPAGRLCEPARVWELPPSGESGGVPALNTEHPPKGQRRRA